MCYKTQNLILTLQNLLASAMLARNELAIDLVCVADRAQKFLVNLLVAVLHFLLVLDVILAKTADRRSQLQQLPVANLLVC